jgi:two-component system chemotaxis response regulator CheV
VSDFLKNVDARTRLAGTNKLEILMFSLGVDAETGRRETYGINVFKVREVMQAPPITKAPDMAPAVEGMVSLRGMLVPVVDLAKYLKVKPDAKPSIMIVTEYNGQTQGFLVESVDTILRLDWSLMKIPPDMLTAHKGGLITAVTELPDKRLVMMLDVEMVIADTGHYGSDEQLYKGVVSLVDADKTVFFVDDSGIARKQIERTLNAMHLRHLHATNGKKAWQELKKIADSAEAAHRPVSDYIQLIMTDVEMPEMDGYMLTRLIKEDRRFSGIPVLMHSSLSSKSNQNLGAAVGVDGYVSKFEPQKLSQLLASFLH